MSIRYRTRARRLERTISRIETARRSIAGHQQTAAGQESWWRRHRATIESWRREIDRRHQRQGSADPAAALAAFRTWIRRRRMHPSLLKLRFDCWWLALRAGKPRR